MAIALRLTDNFAGMEAFLPLSVFALYRPPQESVSVFPSHPFTHPQMLPFPAFRAWGKLFHAKLGTTIRNLSLGPDV
jgi:hypothetical protein